MKHNFSFLIKIIVCLSIISLISITINIYLILNPREILREYKDNTWPDAKYKFNETLSGCENGSKLIWDEETRSAKVNAQSSDKCYLYFDHEKFTQYLINLYQKAGENNLYYHDGNSNDSNSNLEAGDFSYRYSGSSASVNNYVCFGGECSNEVADPGYKNLYRIIGLFKNNADQYEMKIIKADEAIKEDLGEGTYPENAYIKDINPTLNYKGKFTKNFYYSWNDTAGTTEEDNNVNMWKESNLNTQNLNKIFYESIQSPYKDMISEHEWQVGGSSDFGNAKAVYESELGNNKLISTSNNCYTQGNPSKARQCNLENDLTYKANVGLMYISDYMYGTLPEFWNTKAENYSNEDVKTNNWIYIGLSEWTISRRSDSGFNARGVHYPGYAGITNLAVNDYGIRPVLYLSSDVKITGGLGTEKNPYKLSM